MPEAAEVKHAQQPLEQASNRLPDSVKHQWPFSDYHQTPAESGMALHACIIPPMPCLTLRAL
jgi:hypothetical protein